jgi:hypothetical protein
MFPPPGPYFKSAAGLVFLGTSLLASSALAETAGTVNLAAAESRKVWLGPTYWWLRVCNNTHSKGTVTVTIDNRDSQTLAPSLCTENSGSSIDLWNDSSVQVTVVYRMVHQSFRQR